MADSGLGGDGRSVYQILHESKRSFLASVWKPLATLVAVTLLGTGGYVLIEGWTPFEALYMTIITLATVGYGEVHELSSSGRIFTTVLIMLSVGVVGYVFGAVTSFLVEGHLAGMVEQTQTLRRISKLQDHIVICGSGRMGASAASELRALGATCVIIDLEPHEEWGEDDEILFLHGSATQEATLIAAGIERAKGLVCAMGEDSHNVTATVIAKSIAPHVVVLARATGGESERVLHHAGADESVSPYVIGGQRMALGILHPELVGFWDTVMRAKEMRVQMGSIGIPPGSSWIGRTLRETRELLEADVTLIGVKHPDGEVVVNPPKGTVLQEEDLIVVLGDEDQVGQVMDMVAASAR
ncbi:MAG: potassium channel protein [Armatimonadia bacterium]|nr:potassium channel protein [Armatimonadia bacterium]